MSSPKNRFKFFGFISCLILINLIWLFVRYVCDLKITYAFSAKYVNPKKDWHDYEAIKAALAQEGPGEVGAKVSIDEYKAALYKEYGYDAVLSDLISLNRSVPDVRPAECKKLRQLAQLPKVSIIIIFLNERLSVLLRTVYGIINRSPSELIHEIILVDDNSTYADLQNPLTDHLRRFLPTVRLIRLPERSGLVVARMTGARAASKESEVLIFLDSHMEVNYNWLPPLLEPIALNPKACTTPALDYIQFDDFKYEEGMPFRGYFDWGLNYKFFRVNQPEKKAQAENYYDYVMCGGAIAIGAPFFWDLGGFDEGMRIWGGEQFELSFKIWMCGGELIQVPCSRMAHLFRDPDTKGNENLYGNYDFLYRNIRRLVDVWMDNEHRQYVFNRQPIIKRIDPGDLTDRISIRDRLKCKSFSWMMENIMPDIKYVYPIVKPKPLAKGLLTSIYDPNICVAFSEDKEVILESCEAHKNNKFWIYNWLGQMLTTNRSCLEANRDSDEISLQGCSEVKESQKWYYDRENQWVAKVEDKLCMTANLEKGIVNVVTCDSKNITMKWTFTHIYESEMDKWESKLNWSSIF